jgi:uncharacterized protein YbjT (DUF2867 family)
MTIFVMGATGRVGGAVVRNLRGRVALRAATQTARPAEPDIEWVTFNLLSPAGFGEALEGVEDVFLMRPPQLTHASDFSPFLEALQSRGIRRVVALSVKGAENNPLLPHHGMEKAIKERGFAWTMVRPSDFMQNLETIHLEGIRDRDVISVPAGRGRSAFIDVADIGEVVAKVITEAGHDGQGYTLTGPASLSFTEVAAALTAALRRPITYRDVGIAQFLLEQHQLRRALGLNLVMAMLYTVQRIGGADGTTGDLEALLGRQATPLATYLERNKVLWQPNRGFELLTG